MTDVQNYSKSTGQKSIQNGIVKNLLKFPANVEFNDELDRARVDFGEVKDFYDQNAKVYEKLFYENNLPINHYTAESLANHIVNKDTAHVLDVPCGTGFTGQSLRDVGFQIIDGNDISEGMVNIAKEKNIYRNFVKGCILEKKTLKCADNLYDGVISVQGIGKGHFPLSYALREFHRVLKPNGYMAYTVNLDCGIDGLISLHNEYFLQGMLELVLLEKRYYYEVRKENKTCFFCIMKKLK